MKVPPPEQHGNYKKDLSMRKFKPTEAQKVVLNLKEGRHLVLAPPGSGKTELLALRVQRALHDGVAPDEMLCVTFTNRASRNMVSRIGDTPGRRPFIGTLHNFALRFLFENALIPANTVLLDEEDAEQMRADALESVREESRSAPVVKAKQVETHARARSQHRLKLGPLAGPFVSDVFLDEIADRYERLKADACSIDFDDALHLTLHHLLHGQPRRRCHHAWVQVDEVQDLSELQWAILGRLLADDAHVVYFGDYDQAIFSFMGASHSGLSKNTHGAEIHHLKENYRSPPTLIDLFNDYAAANLPSRREHHLEPAEDSELTGGDIARESVSGTFADEARAIAKRVIPRLLAKHDTTAILVRTNKDADVVSNSLAVEGIDHFKVSGFDLFRRKPIKDVMAFLRARHFALDRQAWARLLSVFGGIDTLRASRQLVTELFDSGIHPAEWLADPVEQSLGDRFAAYFSSGRWVIFDTETTGLSTADDDIVQIAAVEMIDGKPSGREFEVYLATDKDLLASSKVHKITPAYLQQHGVPPAEGLRRFLEFAGDAGVIGHNVRFDKDVLVSNLARAGLQWTSRGSTFDTLTLARRTYPRLLSYKLGFLLDALGLEGQNSHNALDDVRATAALAQRLAVDAAAGRERRLELARQYRKNLEKFSTALGPLWREVSELLDQEAHLGEVMERFFAYGAERVKYRLDDGEKGHVATLLGYLAGNTPRRPLRKLLSSVVPEMSTYSEADLITGRERVVVSTIHKAKGLQFQGVVVTSCVDDVYPSYFAKRDKDKRAIEEDARLLYVAMTRAQSSLVLSMHDTSINPYGREFPRWPSPFLGFLRD